MYNSYSVSGGQDATFLGYSVEIWVISILLYALYCVSYMGIFRKAGKPSWAAFVPIYNSYLISEIVFGKGIFCIFSLIPYLGRLYSMVVAYRLGVVFNRSSLFNIGLILLPFIFLPILAFSPNSYYSGAGTTEGMYITGGTLSSDYGQRYYEQVRNNIYNNDEFYGQNNNYDKGYDNGYVSQNENTYDNSFNSQNNGNNDFYNQNNNRY